MKKHYYCGNYGIEIQTTPEQAKRGSHQGQCDSDIEELLPELKEQMDAIDPDNLRKELKEYGAWSEEELNDHEANLRRILWIACGDIRESVA
jgi:hypothetical protein